MSISLAILYSSFPLSQYAKDLFHLTALRMLREKLDRVVLDDQCFCGVVTTQGKFHCINSNFKGVEFTADLESNNGRGKVVFLVVPDLLGASDREMVN